MVPGAANNSRIVFASDEGSPGNYDIYVINADGSAKQNLTSSPTSNDRQPSWSPDGTQIVFTTNRDGNDEVYTMRDDGANLVNLTNNAGADYQPAWAPLASANRIAFVSDRDGEPEVYTISTLGGAVTKVTNNGIDDLNPSYSPDSTRLVYQSGGNIMARNADGTGAETPLSSSGQDSEPAWSPSGSYIVYVSTRDAGNAELYRVTSDGSTTDRLTSTASLETNPGWSPDSSELVYTEESGGVRELRRAYYTGLSIRPIGSVGIDPDWTP